MNDSSRAVNSSLSYILANIFKPHGMWFEFSGAIELVAPTQLPLLRGHTLVLLIAAGSGSAEAAIAVKLRCISILTRIFEKVGRPQ